MNRRWGSDADGAAIGAEGGNIDRLAARIKATEPLQPLLAQCRWAMWRCEARNGDGKHSKAPYVAADLGFSLNPDDRAFTAILKAKTTILEFRPERLVRETGLMKFWPPPKIRSLIWRGHTGANAPKLVDNYIGDARSNGTSG
jgi:hypothetical protein